MNGSGFSPPKLVPWVLVSVSVATMLTLATKHQTLREDYLEHRRADMRVPRGSFVPTFRGIAVTGDSLTIGETAAGGRQVLMLLTSTCPYCRATLPSWQRIADLVVKQSRPGASMQVVGVTTDSVHVAAKYAESNRLTFPLLSLPTWKIKALYRAHTVPQTLVVDSDGLVVFARHGVINTPEAVDSVVAAATAPEKGARQAREAVPR